MDDERFALQCPHCKYLFPDDITQGVAAAHYEMEHDLADVTMMLVVVCRNHEAPVVMTMLRTERRGAKDWHYYSCDECHRGRLIKQGVK